MSTTIAPDAERDLETVDPVEPALAADDPMKGWRPAVALSLLAGLLGAAAAGWALWIVRHHTVTFAVLTAMEVASVALGVWSGVIRRGQVEAGIASLKREAAANAADLRRLANERAALTADQEALAEEEKALQERTRYTFVNLSMRTLTLVERQLDLIDRLEHGEDDPDRLEDLFRLDHLATRMRRNGENILVITGADDRHGYRPPTPLLDVVRAAVSEIERYERIDVGHLPTAELAGHTADDLSHLLAELLENAAAYSAPESRVQVSGRSLENGSVVLSVDDEGIGMPGDRLAELNERLQGDAPAASDPGDTGLGAFVVGALSHRHGLRAQLRPRPGGGLTAMVVVPASILAGEKPSPAEISAERDRERELWAQLPAVRPAGDAAAVPPAADDGGSTPDDDAADQAPANGRAADTPAGRRAFRHPDAARVTPPTAEEPAEEPGGAPAPVSAPAPDTALSAPQPAVGRTPKGLPKRITAGPDAGYTPAAGTAAVRLPARGDSAPVPAEELRRRLSGFQEGLAAGRAEDDAPATAHTPADDAAGPQGGAAR